MRRRPATDEGGQALVLFTLLLIPLLMIIALVLDVAQARVDRREQRSASDAAARAAIADLPAGPWPAVCRARDYLLGNQTRFHAFDGGSVVWSDASATRTTHASDPCGARAAAPYVTPCAPNTPSTWAKLTATGAGGLFTVEIQSGYALPDPRFPEDASRLDGGDPARGSCDNAAVIITTNRPPGFAQVANFTGLSTRVRSVARLNTLVTVEYVAALQLLERHKCNVLQTGGANTRVIVQPFEGHPGVIQIDSAGDAASCPQPIITGQATGGSPSIVACSAASAVAGCLPSTGTRLSRIGVHALSRGVPPGSATSAFPSTYGDTAAVPTPQSGRKRADERYRQNLANLDASAKATFSGNLPPGCTVTLLQPLLNSTCNGTAGTWLVVQPLDCGSLTLPLFFAVPGRAGAQRIWFNCDLTVSSPLTLTAAGSTVVVNGKLSVGSTFGINNPGTVFVKGRSTGDKIGLDISGATSSLNVNNLVNGRACSGRTGPGRATTLVVGDGRLNVSSGAQAFLCQTFVYLASGWDKIPVVDATEPCTTVTCTSYLGTISVSSGAGVDWSAPNGITDRQPEDWELASTVPFEDLALWTEAGGNTSGLTGGASTSLSGIYFLPNADSFNLAGNGSLPVYLSAQFIATSLKITGGATLYLVPNPQDSIQVITYSTLLVR